MAANVPTIAVAIPTFYRSVWLEAALNSVIWQLNGNDEILVVGRDEDVEARRVFDRVSSGIAIHMSWCAVDVPGHLAPIGIARDVAASDLLAVLDDDSVAEDGWAEAARALFCHERVACVGGPAVTRRPGLVVPRTAGRISMIGRLGANVAELVVNQAVEVDTVQESNMVWRTSVLRDLILDPLFHEHAGIYYGLHLTLQAQRKGFRIIYNPELRTRHFLAPRTVALRRNDLYATAYYNARNYVYVLMRERPVHQVTLYLFWSTLLGGRSEYGLLSTAVDVARRRDVTIIRQLLATLKGRASGVRRALGSSCA